MINMTRDILSWCTSVIKESNIVQLIKSLHIRSIVWFIEGSSTSMREVIWSVSMKLDGMATGSSSMRCSTAICGNKLQILIICGFNLR